MLITNMMIKDSEWTDDSVELCGTMKKINRMDKLDELSKCPECPECPESQVEFLGFPPLAIMPQSQQSGQMR
ncbi:MAG: hypothetical protein EZS28_026235 [Streblomastix strix]|uniref:Uncharacterized protein n=1 Tax=Streblomastix strix TaxID=222440 RepID=A0A5J4V689_9EUKA|nr:MAG: hypothetical protein EZS28_026235 [Streblomastix strix]